MRNVLKDIREVAHYWANQVQESGKSGSLRFNGTTLYSYAEPIARILPNGTAVFTTRRWSATTGKHQAYARQAAHHRRSVYCRAVQDSPTENMANSQLAIVRLLNSIKPEYRKDGVETVNSVNRASKLRLEALYEADRANEYLRACHESGIGIDVPMIDKENLEGVRQALLEQEKERERQYAARLAERAEKQKEGLAKWREGGPLAEFGALPVALRLHEWSAIGHRECSIQTSHGAQIPVEAAKKLWPFLLACKAGGRAFDTSHQLGSYTLNKIYPNGDIKVGCHLVPFAEMEKIAVQLGLVEEVAA